MNNHLHTLFRLNNLQMCRKAQSVLAIPRVKITLSVAAPTRWNTLPVDVKPRIPWLYIPWLNHQNTLLPQREHLSIEPDLSTLAF